MICGESGEEFGLEGGALTCLLLLSNPTCYRRVIAIQGVCTCVCKKDHSSV